MKPLLKCGHTIFRDKCPECKALQTHFYKKLKEENFEDIEDTHRLDRLLKSWHSFKFTANHDAENYYSAALEVLHSYPFEKPVHRFIWELHCEGKSKREIETLVAQSAFEKKYKRESILNLINKIAKETIR